MKSHHAMRAEPAASCLRGGSGRRQDRHRRVALTLCVLLPTVFGPGTLASAHHERVITPHWTWERLPHAAGTVRVLAIVSDKAMREPDELAQRFDMDCITVPVRGDNYRNMFDEDVLMECLAKGVDVIAVAAPQPVRDLSEKARAAIAEAVSNGTALVRFGSTSAERELRDWLVGDSKGEDLTAVYTRGQPVDRIDFRGGRLHVQGWTHGKGRILLASGYDNHFVYFNAFVPRPGSYAGNAANQELSYAVAARLLRGACGQTVGSTVRVAGSDGVIHWGQHAALHVQSESGPLADARISWTLHTLAGEQVAAGDSEAAESVELPTPRGGDLVAVWRLERDGTTLDTGALSLSIVSPLSFQSLDATTTLPRDTPLRVSWQLAGLPTTADTVEVQVYDPDRQVVSLARAGATDGRAECPPWAPNAVTYLVRALLLRDGRAMAEERSWCHVPADRRRDAERFQVIVWGTEKGAAVERWRFARLRQLGVTAVAPIGKRAELCEMLSEVGLRAVPTNVYVPAALERYRKNDRSEKDAQQLMDADLTSYVDGIARYSPLGYSLADEPSGADVVTWRDQGATAIHTADPGAPVGYCGFWPNTGGDLTRLLRAVDFAEGYSPTHLYTPDLWRGTERDLYRGLRRPGTIFTCWTHYAPKRDMEPYSRTVPWLWLFEGFTGVSYFDSAGAFAVLPSHMRTTHETRWWSEEVLRLHQGIAEQVIRARRDTGAIAVVYGPHASGLSAWLCALNHERFGYRVVDRADLDAGVLAGVRAVMLPGTRELSSRAIAHLTRFARNGGLVVGTGQVGLLAPIDEDAAEERAMAAELGLAEPASEGRALGEPGRLRELFGIVRQSGQTRLEDWELARGICTSVPCQAAPTGNAPGVPTTGMTTGAVGFNLVGGEQAATFTQLGRASRGDEEVPEFVENLFTTPAAVWNKHDAGASWYLAYDPDVEGLRGWLRDLLPEHGVRPIPEYVTFDGKVDDTVLVFPFNDGPIRMVGVVQDYWRTKPSEELAGVDRECTRAYFRHGPQRWETRDAAFHTDTRRHWYDTRNGRYMGNTDRFSFPLTPGRPELFSGLPYRVAELVLRCPQKTAPGTRLSVGLDLATDGAASGDHIIHVTLTDPTGKQHAGWRTNVTSRDGQATARFSVPHNAMSGPWTVRAVEALTGTAGAARVQVSTAQTPPVDVLPEETVFVRGEPLPWPDGDWEPFRETDDQDGVNVQVQSLQRKRLRDREPYGYKWHLVGGFSLRNTLRDYTFRYQVCDDWEALGWEQGRCWAPYLPGLGLNRPQPHFWYYNSYIGIKVGEHDASGYVLTRLDQVEDSENGRVEVTWEPPFARIDLSFVLLPDHAGIFQELVVTPRDPADRVVVAFKGYPGGFGKPNQPFSVTGENRSWWLAGNKLLDRAYGKGRGCGAILLLPEELDEVKFGRMPVLTKRIGPSADGTVVESVRMRWVLWLFPELPNSEAEAYMRENATDTRRRLKKLFAPKTLGENRAP